MIKLFENQNIPSFEIKPEITISIVGKRIAKPFNKKKYELIRGQFKLFCDNLETELADYSIRISIEKDETIEAI